jgi:hypothetical protein
MRDDAGGVMAGDIRGHRRVSGERERRDQNGSRDKRFHGTLLHLWP